jgi:hypothetical protein
MSNILAMPRSLMPAEEFICFMYVKTVKNGNERVNIYELQAISTIYT